MKDKKIDKRTLGGIVANLIDEVEVEDKEEYENIEDLRLDELIDIFGEEIFEGIEEVTKTIGQIHAFTLVGIEPQEALDYLLQLKALEHEKAIVEKNGELQLKMAKFDGLKANKNEM